MQRETLLSVAGRVQGTDSFESRTGPCRMLAMSDASAGRFVQPHSGRHDLTTAS